MTVDKKTICKKKPPHGRGFNQQRRVVGLPLWFGNAKTAFELQ
jgi:hypothetical protein